MLFRSLEYISALALKNSLPLEFRNLCCNIYWIIFFLTTDPQQIHCWQTKFGWNSWGEKFPQCIYQKIEGITRRIKQWIHIFMEVSMYYSKTGRKYFWRSKLWNDQRFYLSKLWYRILDNLHFGNLIYIVLEASFNSEKLYNLFQ